MPKRVVVTGMGAVTALGNDWAGVGQSLRTGTSGIRAMPEWADLAHLSTQVAGPADHFVFPAHYSRKKVRGMGRVAQLATCATEAALSDAGLLDSALLTSGQLGIAYGSSAGATEATCSFAQKLTGRDLGGTTATEYVRMMSHTTAVNLGVFFEVCGRVYTTSSACTSGSQGIGYAFEAIQSGKQTAMIAGGAEELCPLQSAVFDAFRAASRKNDTPDQTPSPFDAGRDGLVIGEGAGTLILEELEHARDRGATIYAELIGYGTNADGSHLTQPDSRSMQAAMQLALDDAALQPGAVDYINAHGTATPFGDRAESDATYRLFGSGVPVSTLKGHLGHTLGAGGAIEAWASIQMMREGWLAPTLNLHRPDPECAPLDYVYREPREHQCQRVMSNNFAFGGINTSLIFQHAP